jgi:hypothetical protein
MSDRNGKPDWPTPIVQRHGDPVEAKLVDELLGNHGVLVRAKAVAGTRRGQAHSPGSRRRRSGILSAAY